MGRLIILFLVIFHAGLANATLVQRDFVQGSGDNLIIFDSSSNLEWLNLNVTRGYSVNQIKNNWSGLLSQGFQFASRADLGGLVGSLGLSLDTVYTSTTSNYSGTGYVTSNDAFSSIVGLVDKLGATVSSYDLYGVVINKSVMGYLSDANSNSNYGSTTYAYIGYSFASQTAAVSSYGTTANDSLNSNYGELGSFMVRSVPTPVPEPSSYALLLAGLFALYLNKRGKKN